MRKLVTIREVLNVKPIEGADSIELATVDGWNCVVKKGEFRAGDFGVYFEIDSLLPMVPQFEFLKPRGTKKMLIDGKEFEGYRLRTIKLRGQVSQGLLLKPDTVFGEDWNWSNPENINKDLSELAGVIKYEAPIPAQLSGKVKGNFPEFIQKTDQERCQNIMKDLVNLVGFNFEITEKLDGSSMTVYLKDGVFGVCSRNLDLQETEGSTMWRLARELQLEEKLKAYGKNYAIQGECIGQGIQGNPYKITGQTFKIFDIYDIDSQAHLGSNDRIRVLEEMGLTEYRVPTITGCFPLMENNLKADEEAYLLKLAEGKSQLCETEREGVVFKTCERFGNNTFSFKVISNKFLLNEV